MQAQAANSTIQWIRSLKFISRPRLLRFLQTSAFHWPENSTPDYEVDHVIVGAGVVGLAIAERLTRTANTSTLIVERHRRPGSECSARNSEVIHAGIYYPPNSLKTKLCIRGRHLLYDFCSQHSIPHRKCSKWIVAQSPAELDVLHEIHKRGTALDVPLRFLSTTERAQAEPLIRAQAGALESPETGIIDSHTYMEQLQMLMLSTNPGEASLALSSTVVGIQRDPVTGSYDVAVQSLDADTETSNTTIIRTPLLVNSAGLHSDHIASLVLGPSMASSLAYTIHPHKGHYYSLSGPAPASRLVYPTPLPNLQGLGVHLTLDMSGRCKFGPDSVPVADKADYSVVEPGELGAAKERERRHMFWQGVERYFPGVREEDLVADYSGIRPKLSAPGQPFRDFVIKEETQAGFPGFVNLVGALSDLQ
ncbi:hypothetical protein HDU93_000926 [Gonapodya sp. JEL0774]|nr:hypothetical protein HDU93_000926 [Gonapodya sp. JEL0774]